MILKQKQGWKRKEFEIIDNNELRVKVKESGELKEYKVHLESIGHNLIYHQSTRNRWYIWDAVFVAYLVFITIALYMSDDFNGNLPVVLVSYGIFVIMIILTFVFPLKKEIHLVGGTVNLTLFQDCPSKEEVDKFISEIISLSKQILLKKYARIDVDLPEDTMMTQLNWLKNRDLITEEEYSDLKKAYKTQRLIKS